MGLFFSFLSVASREIKNIFDYILPIFTKKCPFISEGYFEGINVYQSYLNPRMVGVLDYFEDYIIVYDEIVEIFAKISFIQANICLLSSAATTKS